MSLHGLPSSRTRSSWQRWPVDGMGRERAWTGARHAAGSEARPPDPGEPARPPVGTSLGCLPAIGGACPPTRVYAKLRIRQAPDEVRRSRVLERVPMGWCGEPLGRWTNASGAVLALGYAGMPSSPPWAAQGWRGGHRSGRQEGLLGALGAPQRSVDHFTGRGLHRLGPWQCRPPVRTTTAMAQWGGHSGRARAPEPARSLARYPGDP